ncbi:MAG TPA: hypothetical protein VNK04_00360 [Gemmataceae bacterium]|jgi:hypothetical protein|nr:hypothetical protein [Gemmataceae bacterium]
MKKVKLVVVILALAAAMPALRGHGQEPKKEPKKLDDAIAKDLSDLMKRKLEHSQKVLEGVALNDFNKIAKHADELIFISKRAEWKVLKTPQYELHSNEFRRTAEELVQKAKDKNLDGAALAYVDLTLTCVKCHKHVREVRNVRFDLTGPPAVARGDK